MLLVCMQLCKILHFICERYVNLPQFEDCEPAMSELASLHDLPAPISEVARAADDAGGSVIVFDKDDHVIFVNIEQRKIMPCCEYKRSDTYSSLFWSLLEKGINGNSVAKKDPELWLRRAIGARLNSANMDFVNSYPWGKMLVSHYRCEDGTSIQARLNMTSAGLEHYFQGPEANLGVTRAIRLRREIRALEGVLDSLGLAVALVDRNGALLHANVSFHDVLDAQDGLVNLTGTLLSATDQLDNMVLHQTLGHVADGLVPRAYAPIRRRSGDPLVLAVSAGTTPGTAILAAARFGEDMGEVCTALREAFGMSAAESEVMAGVGSGQTLAEYAGSRQLSMHSAYRYIDRAKKRLVEKHSSAVDLPGIASLVTGIAAVTRAQGGRKH